MKNENISNVEALKGKPVNSYHTSWRYQYFPTTHLSGTRLKSSIEI